ncbi:beta-N-acetylglucosaminidase [Actinomadura verrucosospora]|uniref:Beta-N-acetylglucosaminidase n=1 Tax=Actinomadura verrucosospora TaxID=46165 RepID=A0A7D3ZWG8_ACTVE|nr:beta-N-acetylglucosaminidase [Actinomadura verrucosospora]
MAGAAGGLTLLAGGAADAATAMPHRAPAPQICRYEVTASKLNVRQGPGTRWDTVPPQLNRGKHLGADCITSQAGWHQLRSNQVGKWVTGQFLRLISHHGRSCRYAVTASSLNVRTGPGTGWPISPPSLRRGQHITADCRPSEAGWKSLRQSVPPNQLGKWVSGAFLKPIRSARGGVMAGAGGTAAAPTSPMLAGAGLGVVALGGGVAVAAFRRRAKGLA